MLRLRRTATTHLTRLSRPVRRGHLLRVATPVVALAVGASALTGHAAPSLEFSTPVRAIPFVGSSASQANVGEPNLIVLRDRSLLLSAQFQPYDCETRQAKAGNLRPCVWRSSDDGRTFGIIGGESTGMRSNDVQLLETPKGTLLQVMLTNKVGTGVGGSSVARSTDGGKTWTTLLDVTGREATDRPWLVQAGSRIVLTYTALPGNIFAVVSDDDGATWGLPQPVTTAPPNLVLSANGVPAYDPGRRQTLSPYAYGSSPGALTFPSGDFDRVSLARSGDDGASWTLEDVAQLPAGHGAVSFPVSAIDATGTEYIAFAASGTDEIQAAWLSRRLPGATGWEPPRRVSAAGHSAMLPWVVANGDGGVAVAWYDTPFADGRDASRPWRPVVSVSQNRGSTWSDAAIPTGTSYRGTAASVQTTLWDALAFAVDGDGCLHLAWTDAGPDAPPAMRNDIAYAQQVSGAPLGVRGRPCRAA